MTHAFSGARGRARRGSRWRRLAPARVLAALLVCLTLLSSGPPARAAELPEYRLKAAFLYNFVLYTEWPAEVGSNLNVCIHGQDPFGADIDELNGKPAAARTISVQRKPLGASLAGCQVVFIAPSAMPSLARVLEAVRGLPVLTVADSPGAGRQGVMLNMSVAQEKIAFEADLRSARAARLDLSSKLLRLATEVYK
jgi:YfiR/HmsC-like